jgi:choline dehydrogenase-like flavoprotein
VAEDYDIIIVGSGAGGGTLAHTLAHTGKRILIVERGGFLPGGDARTQTWYDPHGRPFPAGKADADLIAVRSLLDLPNVTLVTGAEVTRLETDPRGRSVTGVVVNRGGGREVCRGGLVVLAAGAVNSARILLKSARGPHPGGLANGSGLFGRNLMVHNQVAMVAAVGEPHQAAVPQTLAIHDFYLGGPGAGGTAARLLYRSLRTMLGATKLIDPGGCATPGGPTAPRHSDGAYAGTCRFGHDPAASVLDVGSPVARSRPAAVSGVS